MIRVIIDTNVLISAALRDRDPETLILRVAARADIEWIVSSDIRAEYEEVVGRPKFAFPDEIVAKWKALVRDSTTLVDLEIESPPIRDRKDAKFLVCALASEADLLVTGDRDFEGLSGLGELRVVSVVRALELLSIQKPSDTD